MSVMSRYAYLIDRKGRVRWRGSGTASAKEVEEMLISTRSVVQEDQNAA